MENNKLSVILFAGIALAFCAMSTYAVPPMVTKTIPENGNENVDPDLRIIRIEFDQDMSRDDYSVCGGGQKYPKTRGKPKWINKRTLTMQVILQPSHEYELSVNCQSYRNFKNLQGESAVIYPIKFKTSSAAKKASRSSKSPSLLLQEGLYAEKTEGNLEKAISLYEQVRKQYKDVERLASRATYRLGMCHLKKGEKEKAVEYFQEVSDYYPEQKRLAKKAQKQLDKMGISKVKQGNIFEILGGEVSAYIGSKYGEVCAEAGAKKLYSNSHIYVVDSDFVLRSGGMGYVYNWTQKPITKHYRVSGASYPDQKLYSMYDDEMDIEIVPNKNRKNFYNIYWNPEKPLQPGEFFNYGWARDSTKQLSPVGTGGKYFLTMKNNLGRHAYETFFLAVPQGTVLSDKSKEYTNRETVNSWDIYWWKKEVQQDENHVVNVTLAKKETQYVFGPVIEKIINDDGVDEDFMFDLDTCKFFSVSDAKKWSEAQDVELEIAFGDFLLQSGADLFGETSKKSLLGINIIAIPTHKERWNISPEHVIEHISTGKAGYPIPLSADGKLPKTFVFKTRQGGMGILQITEMQTRKDPPHFKIRYKMLQKLPVGWQHNKYHIVDDTVLDLDRGIIIGASKDVPREYDIGWDNNGGGVLIVNPKKSARIIGLSGIGKSKNKEAIEIAEKSLDLLRESPSESILAKQIVFCAVLTNEGNLAVIEIAEYSTDKATLNVWMKEKTKSPIDMSTPEATIKSFVNAVYNGNLENAKACVSKDGADYDEFMEMLATESNHPFQAMIKAMDTSNPVEIISKDITENRCKIKWYLTLGRVYYIGDTRIEKGMHQKFGSYLELVGDKWLIRDI